MPKVISRDEINVVKVVSYSAADAEMDWKKDAA
jgi:hypothetical protein